MTRGIRNHNPGNIDHNSANKWQGQIGIETGVKNPRFCRFESPEYGIRALMKLLTNYHKNDEQQATLLITYMRNNDIVRAFKKRLVSEFFRMRSALASKKMDRNTSRLEYKPMTDAIKKSREDLGKDILPRHFSNEADLINRIALGMTAAKFRVHHDIDKKEPIRDYLTPEQMRCITELQRANTVFISMG
ncbi:hypothetical protein [Xenorhabdus japonica]|uniref:Uncharacterized protein n=1 Tax=Xenorhabdus japonica TaxID=53341 RepID=A0A1I5E2L3_9GAMM|nr:hypothetical protein [Xenorhabdus japonica]SFO05754.1 hypothetical protein SAMN05421579_1526 [Xenorhabdus japonica]